MIQAINRSRGFTIKPSHPRIHPVDMLESTRLTKDTNRNNMNRQTKDHVRSPIITPPNLNTVMTKGKGLMEAIDLGLQQLGVPINEVFIEVIEEAKANLEADTIVKITKKLSAVPSPYQTDKKTNTTPFLNTYKANNLDSQYNYNAYI
jgi:hypothetical protein